MSPAVASKVVLTKTPSAGTVGVVLGTSLIAAIEDQFGNVVTTDVSAVSLTINTGPVGSVFTTDSILTTNAVAGVATFSNLKLNTSGIYTFNAADSKSSTGNSLASGNSASVVLAAGAASQMVILSLPSNATAGTSSATVKIGIEDQFGNFVPSISTVTLTLVSGKVLNMRFRPANISLINTRSSCRRLGNRFNKLCPKKQFAEIQEFHLTQHLIGPSISGWAKSSPSHHQCGSYRTMTVPVQIEILFV